MRNGRTDELIEQFIELDPRRPGKAEARLKMYHTKVWALAGYLPAVCGDLDRVASDYHLPREAVEAAIAFYERYKDIIDDRLAANASDVYWPSSG